MTRAQRRLHARAWPVLGLILAAVIAGALMARRPDAMPLADRPVVPQQDEAR